MGKKEKKIKTEPKTEPKTSPLPQPQPITLTPDETLESLTNFGEDSKNTEPDNALNFEEKKI